MALAVDIRRGLASLRTACSLVMDSVSLRVGSVEAADMHKTAAEGSHVRVIQNASTVRMEDSRGECTETGPESSRRSEDRREGGCTFQSLFRVQFCGIDGFHDSQSAREVGRR